MSSAEEIKGKIIRIPSSYSVILDVGSKQGVQNGMKFVIYVEGEPIYAPDGKNLGKIEYVKAIVQVTHVQENFSIAENVEFSDPTTVYGSIAISLRWRKALPVSEEDIKPLALFDKIIKVGDLARQLKRIE